MIKHSAVKTKNGIIYVGKRHGDCFELMFNLGVDKEEAAYSEQGFITDDGVFLNRKLAGCYAKLIGQVENFEFGESLVSEDLW